MIISENKHRRDAKFRYNSLMIQTAYDKLKAKAIWPFISKRGTECYIISYPKCGRTWLRLLIGKVLCDQFDLPEEAIINTHQLTAVPPVLRTHFSHDFSSIKAGFPYNRIPQDKSMYAHKKVLFMIRDVRDTLVSSYFQATRRVNRFSGPMSAFVRDNRFGIKKIIAFYNLWYQQQQTPRQFMLLRYEELHQDPFTALKRSLEFMELQPIIAENLHTAIQFAQFDNMKKMESKGMFTSDKMQPGEKSDQDSFKVRQGKVGGFGDYLNDADLAYINQTIQEMGCPFVEQYYPLQ